MSFSAHITERAQYLEIQKKGFHFLIWKEVKKMSSYERGVPYALVAHHLELVLLVRAATTRTNRSSRGRVVQPCPPPPRSLVVLVRMK